MTLTGWDLAAILLLFVAAQAISYHVLLRALLAQEDRDLDELSDEFEKRFKAIEQTLNEKD